MTIIPLAVMIQTHRQGILSILVVWFRLIPVRKEPGFACNPTPATIWFFIVLNIVILVAADPRLPSAKRETVQIVSHKVTFWLARYGSKLAQDFLVATSFGSRLCIFPG